MGHGVHHHTVGCMLHLMCIVSTNSSSLSSLAMEGCSKFQVYSESQLSFSPMFCQVYRAKERVDLEMENMHSKAEERKSNDQT